MDGQTDGCAGRQSGRQAASKDVHFEGDASYCWPHLLATGTTLASRHTAPATTGDATLVPDRLLHPPWILLPSTSLPYATTSGCNNRPTQLLVLVRRKYKKNEKIKDKKGKKEKFTLFSDHNGSLLRRQPGP